MDDIRCNIVNRKNSRRWNNIILMFYADKQDIHGKTCPRPQLTLGIEEEQDYENCHEIIFTLQRSEIFKYWTLRSNKVMMDRPIQ